MNQVHARFKIEGKPQRSFAFMCKSSVEAEQVEEIQAMVAQEFGCHRVDVEVVQIGDDPKALKEAPPPAKTYPTKSEIAGMPKANVVVLAKELGVEADFSKLKVDQVRDLVNEKIEELQTNPEA